MKKIGSFDGISYDENQRTIKEDDSSINMISRDNNSNLDGYSWPSYNKSNDINYKAMEFLRV